MSRINKAFTRAVVALFVLAGATARADESAPQQQPLRFEATPLVGYGLGGTFRLSDSGQSLNIRDHASFGLALDAQAADIGQYELLYATQSTDLQGQGFGPVKVRLDYLQIGGTEFLGESQRFRPYILATVGATRIDPASANGSETTRFSLSGGVGVRAPLNRHLSVRIEGRGFLTLLSSDTDIFCRSDQSGALCHVRARGSGLFQFDFFAGAAYAF
jgi:hypothetical protein